MIRLLQRLSAARTSVLRAHLNRNLEVILRVESNHRDIQLYNLQRTSVELVIHTTMARFLEFPHMTDFQCHAG